MNLPRLWTTGQEVTWDPFRAMRREMENALRAFDQNLPSSDIGAGAPAINVAETKDAFEVNAELPGVDENRPQHDRKREYAEFPGHGVVAVAAFDGCGASTSLFSCASLGESVRHDHCHTSAIQRHLYAGRSRAA